MFAEETYGGESYGLWFLKTQWQERSTYLIGFDRIDRASVVISMLRLSGGTDGMELLDPKAEAAGSHLSVLWIQADAQERRGDRHNWRRVPDSPTMKKKVGKILDALCE
jgi:hypothetical protein